MRFQLHSDSHPAIINDVQCRHPGDSRLDGKSRDGKNGYSARERPMTPIPEAAATAVVNIVLTELESRFVAAGIDFLRNQLLPAHVDGIMDLRKKVAVNNVEIISTDICVSDKVPENVRRSIGSFQDKVRAVIERVALEIESNRFERYEEAAHGLHLSKSEGDEVERLLTYDFRLNISFRSLRLAIEIFAQLNNFIIQQIGEAELLHDRRSERDLLLANAILVYELNDFVINFIDAFELDGVFFIEDTRNSIYERLQHLEVEQEKLRNRALDDQIDEGTRERICLSIDNRSKAIRTVQDEWKNYTDEILTLKDSIDKCKKEIKTLALIRDDAKLQIVLLEIAAVTQIIKTNLRTLDGAIDVVKKMELVALTPERIMRLLNIDARV